MFKPGVEHMKRLWKGPRHEKTYAAECRGQYPVRPKFRIQAFQKGVAAFAGEHGSAPYLRIVLLARRPPRGIRLHDNAPHPRHRRAAALVAGSEQNFMFRIRGEMRGHKAETARKILVKEENAHIAPGRL